MGDKTLDSLITMRQFYKIPRKVKEPTNDDEYSVILFKKFSKLFRNKIFYICLKNLVKMLVAYQNMAFF